jgi:electron transfer flavoprotein alpha subunit
MTSVLLIAERDVLGEISQSTLQLISAANELDDPQLTVAIAGSAPESATSLAIGKLVTLPAISDDEVGIYDQITADVAALVTSTNPDIVILSKSDFGTVVGSRVAFRLDLALASDCIAISNSGGMVNVTRPVYGGSALAEFEFASSPAVVTLRPGAYEPNVDAGSPSIEAFESVVAVNKAASVTGTVAQAGEGVRLEDASFVISGGRGLGGAEPFSVLADLANALGGAVGASRAACDAGWIDHSHQVGLTGKSVSPDVYMAVGISGASQHMAGCSSSRVIVAINKDGDSNIFKEARFGVVGDWEKVLPSFLATVRELRA